MQTILFQGDSITDADRSRDDEQNRGLGYPHLISAKLGYENPGKYRLVNRGVSGNRVVDLYARIKCDCINLKPDFMSVLIGVNDVWHEIGGENGVDPDKYERIYSMFIEEVREAVPGIRIMILEPFVTHGEATDPHWDYFSSEVAKRAAAAKRVAEKYSLAFVPLQMRFDDACKVQAPSYWTRDGVHPTPFGHELISRAWLEAFETIR